eukprot:351479-Chlamydomonas_euryale.AAC.22
MEFPPACLIHSNTQAWVRRKRGGGGRGRVGESGGTGALMTALAVAHRSSVWMPSHPTCVGESDDQRERFIIAGAGASSIPVQRALESR